MTVRPATGRDESAMVAAWVDVQAARGLPPGKSRQSQVRAQLRQPLALGLVAVEGSAVVGMLVAEPWRDDADRLVPGVLHLDMLFVTPAAQGRGHGSRLVAALLTRYPEVRVWSRDATAFFEARGFSPTGRDGDAGIELASPALQTGAP